MGKPSHRPLIHKLYIAVQGQVISKWVSLYLNTDSLAVELNLNRYLISLHPSSFPEIGSHDD